MSNSVAWERTIRTGHPANDAHEVEACRAHAASQGLYFEQFPLPHGGVHVRASHPPPQVVAPAQNPMMNAYAPPRANVVGNANANAVAVAGRCQGCGAHTETKNVVLVQNVGVIVLRFQRILKGHFCKRCIRRHFWRMTTIMFFFGWWGLISFVFTVIGIPANIVQYVRTFSMKDPATT